MQENSSSMLKHNLDPQKAQYFHPPHLVTDDVWMTALFSNVFAMQTDVGLLMIDAGLSRMGAQIQQALRMWSDRPIHTLVLTHGHMDHAGGLKDFEKAGDLPQQIVAHENVPLRFDRYDMTNGWNGHINMVQFGLPQPMFQRNPIRPTVTFHDPTTLSLGDLKIELYPAKGETDDMCFIWLPEQRY
ncbi:MAG: MBL fold metallo-hydrolase, partial [Chloroflexota bacterium]